MDHLENVWSSFFAQRTKPLQLRFPGTWRAIVIDTNDPLRMRRVRFKIPEMHDWDLKPEDCPWAVSQSDLGSKRCGRFSYPCIGDWIWITFEKNHPYGPIWTGFATPTRRKFYPLPSIHGKTQIPVGEKSEIKEAVADYDSNYLPKDERPMQHGWQDRYGNLDMHNSTGFFPIEHAMSITSPDVDPLTRGKFLQAANQPEVNSPDSKMMLRISKYGMIFLQADMGYEWKVDGDKGEFTGDVDQDEKFEINRWLYLQKVIHEDKPKNHDQRRVMLLTRYGHKLEMRDTGWNKSRISEWHDKERTIGNGDDERWVKLRTKGGHLIELSDIGFDPENDEFTKRLLLDEAKDVYLDREDKFQKTKTPWNQYGTRDMRMLRFVTRSGLKFAMDDRGSHDGGNYRLPSSASAANRKNEEIGIGMLFKGRATPGSKADQYGQKSGNPIGYYWQFDERPDRNSTTWGTPSGQAIEMDDNEELLAVCSKLPELPVSWKYLDDNEFLERSVDSQEPQKKTHHLLVDHGRELIRLKSRAGHGEPSKNKKFGNAASGEFAGVEIHDAPSDNPWVEMVDHDQRGVWFSRQQKLGIWRARQGSDMSIWLDDGNNNIVVRNATNGKIQIYCTSNIEIISDAVVSMKAKNIEMSADTINLSAGGTSYKLDSQALRTNADIRAKNVYAYFPTAERPAHVAGRGIGAADGGGTPVSNLNIEKIPAEIQPTNRHQ